MKKLRYFGVFLLLSLVSLFAQTNRYELKSGMVEYEIIGSGELSGSAVTISGTSKLYFKDFGNIELTDEKIEQTISGDKEEERVISKVVDNKFYTVDFVDEVIYTQNMLSDEEEPNLNIRNAEAFISMGAKKLGVEEILTYKCDVWQLGEDKIWIYNSVPLKTISKSLGVVQIHEAKLAIFDIKIKEDKFKLPSFPIRAMDEIIGEASSDEMPIPSE